MSTCSSSASEDEYEKYQPKLGIKGLNNGGNGAKCVN